MLSIKPKPKSLSYQSPPLPLVSFDFDGVIHQSVYLAEKTKTGFPSVYLPNSYTNDADYRTDPKMISLIMKERKDHRLVIVSERKPEQGGSLILKYLRRLKMADYFDAVYFTNTLPKTGKLKELQEEGGLIRHYEDSPKEITALRIALPTLEISPIFPEKGYDLFEGKRDPSFSN